MKYRLLVIVFLVLSQYLFSQQRVLISPYGDVIPLQKGQSARAAAAVHARSLTPNDGCTNEGYFGFNRSQYLLNEATYGINNDVMASWFTVPASGVIDTVFWYGERDVCALDSLVFVRMFKSNIYEDHGPGFDEYPPSSSSTCWGYFPSTNDPINSIAAFPEDATPRGDSSWISTVSGPKASYVPFGNEIWGLGGDPVTMRTNSTNFINTNDLPYQPNVKIGDHILITFRINGKTDESCSVGGNATFFGASQAAAETLTHNWKFYEQVPNLPGFSCKGWVARGDFNLLIWYSMTVTTNLPPNILSYSDLKNTLSTGPQTIDAEIQDCDPGNPDSAGVASAYVEYAVNGIEQTPVSLSSLGGNEFEGEIPGAPPGTRIDYNLRAYDQQGLSNFTVRQSYSVINTKTTFAMLDTTAACANASISGTGTSIPPSAFFITPTSGATNPDDDGTAGPFDLGKNFFIGNSSYRYAWVGVNGAMSLTKTATDTADVNSNGFSTSFWTFPYAIRHGRSDIKDTLDMPKTFIAPFWNDVILADSNSTYGHIYYKNDSSSFTVEWDSLGFFNTTQIHPDIMAFRAILNKSDNSIQFQYDNVGLFGLDTTALIGIQGDSTDLTGSGYIFINQNGAPSELLPRNNSCFKIYNSIASSVDNKWNLVSLPDIPIKHDSSVSTNFPTAVSSAFRYAGGYIPAESLSVGSGNWMKFSKAQIIGIPGTPLTQFDIPVVPSWNLIGSISQSIPITSISSTPNGLLAGSSFFGFHDGYVTASSIDPGKGYWVKSTGAGTLHLSNTSGSAKSSVQVNDLSKLQRITIVDASGAHQTLYLGNTESLSSPLSKFELPPPPPQGYFDARFASQRYVETYSSDLSSGKALEYPITIQSNAYPVTISWKSFYTGNATVSLSDNQSGKYVGQNMLNGSGQIVLKNSGITSIVLKVTQGSTKPREFSLSQNYPNPFNPTTRFAVEVPTTSDVTIIVYDVLGRQIATLLNTNEQPGYYTINWNGTDNMGYSVPTGVYIVRMTAGNFSSSRKILLMK